MTDREQILLTLDKTLKSSNGLHSPREAATALKKSGFLDPDYLRSFGNSPEIYLDALSALSMMSPALGFYYLTHAVIAQIEGVGTGHTISIPNLLSPYSGHQTLVDFVPSYLNIEMPLFFKRQNNTYGLFQLSVEALNRGKSQKILGMNSLNFKKIPIDLAFPIADFEKNEFNCLGRFTLYSFAALLIGYLRACTHEVESYIGQRVQGGKTLKCWELVSRDFSELKLELKALELALLAATLEDGAEVQSLFHLVSNRALDFTSKSMDFFGGYGYMREYPIEKYFRATRVIYAMGVKNDF